MKRQMIRLGLSLMVAISFWTTKLPAQAPERPGVPFGHQIPGPELAPLSERPPAKISWPLRRLVNAECFATHNTVGCSSVWADAAFIFGSCRTFFGEPCQTPPRASLFGHARP